MVGGEEAKRCQDTCCESFRERKADSARSSAGSPKEQIRVDCRAHQCTYNRECECHAEKITIAGAGACSCRETECVTFEQER